jgi:hypothetical protein
MRKKRRGEEPEEEPRPRRSFPVRAGLKLVGLAKGLVRFSILSAAAGLVLIALDAMFLKDVEDAPRP